MCRPVIALIFASSVVLAGCGRAAETAPPGAEVDTPPPARTPTVLDPQLQALERAKAVQAQIDAQAEAQRQAIKDAGG
ncbi:hypothetical protein [Aquimonas sp.]|jgi:hypothetical protein|uniref:hypothetical protein n=1 Tax=Aquimonas sp. TaxID=1872588 RepID=UPI0037C08EA1